MITDGIVRSPVGHLGKFLHVLHTLNGSSSSQQPLVWCELC